ncbi:MAG: phage major capsid protein, partial [Caulobacterales bacterium]|nr:phage major capsid protein [Caulobacterales bacterium]
MAAPTAEVRAALSEFLNAFETFKETNDQRLADIERKAAADVVTVEKVDRINAALTEQKAALDRLTLAARRPAIGEVAPAPVNERKAAFEAYVRKGASSPLLETKDLSAGTPAEGGYAVDEETEELIQRRLTAASPIRAIATVRQIGATTFRKPVSEGGTTASWAAETAARTGTTEPTLGVVDVPTAELYAMPAATQTLLDDAYVSIDEWLAGEVEDVFAEMEGAAFVAGDGANKPKGYMDYAKVADASAAWGQIGYVATGVASDFAAAPVDNLIDLIYAPKPAFRADARFVMNRRTLSAVRKFKDSAGDYIWRPSTDAGANSTLLGYPVTEAEDMPDIAASAHPIAFGDFRRGYLIVDRAGIRVLRDPYSAKPFVL